MNEASVLILITLGGYGLYLLGQSLIDAYFRRKEKFVDTLNDKIKGGSNGKTE